MKLKKILATSLIAAMTATTLFGCGETKGKTPTAEELIAKGYGEDEVKSGDMDMRIYMDLSAMVDGESNVTMDTKMDMSANITFDKDTIHMDGSVEATFMGMNAKEKMESYSQKDKDKIINYDKDANEDTWTKEVTDASDDEDSDSEMYLKLATIKASAYKNLKLEDTKDGYIITGTLTADSFEDALNVSAEEFIGDLMGDADYDKVSFNVKSVYDKKTKNLKSIKLTVNGDGILAEGSELKEMYIELKVNKINDVKVEIPKDIVKNAVEDDSDWEDWEDDEDYEDEDDEYNSNISHSQGTSDSTSTPSDVVGLGRTLYSFDDKPLCSISIPNGFNVSLEYTDENAIVFVHPNEDLDIGSIWVTCYEPQWVENFNNGKHKCDTEWYLKDEVRKLDKTVSTAQGATSIYERIWSMTEGYEHTDYAVTLNFGDETVGFEIEEESLKLTNYTLEQFIKDVFNGDSGSAGESVGTSIR